MRRTSFVILAVLLLQACSPRVTVHGYVPLQEDLDLVEPGVDTIGSVEERIGRPSSSGVLRDQAWYYVQTTVSRFTYNPPEVTDREIVAISFDDDGVVEGVERFGLERGQVVALSRRVTPSAGVRQSVVRQIFSNLLNFDPASIFRDTIADN